MDPDTLKSIAVWLGLPTIFLIAGALLVTAYPNFKILIGDFLRVLGRFAQWLRRASLQSELEGSLSLFATTYNRELSTPFLPQCEVKWVTENNAETFWELGKLIVKVGFSRDHDKNLYAATTAFVKDGFIPRAKQFLASTTSEAIDLFLIRTILHDGRRSALRIFNDTFRDTTDECRETYFKLEEIQKQRLFRRMLLQEYYFLGEELGDNLARPQYALEADEFLEWLYSLVTREPDEESVLAFGGKNIRVGAILVAREDTYRQFGVGPYLRRANLYAADEYGTVYLLSRGRRRSRTTKKVAGELVANGNFLQLTDQPDLVVRSEGRADLVTIIPLRANLVEIIQTAWKKLQEAHSEGTTVTVTVESVDETMIMVYAFGLRVEILLDDLSDLEITNARRYFRRLQELEVRVIEVDPENRVVRLSNSRGRTDPKVLIDELEDVFEGGTNAKVEGFRPIDGVEFAMKIALQKGDAMGFVRRSKATHSRFLPLSEKYPLDSIVQVQVLEFDPRFNNFLCEVAGLPDPWADIDDKYQVDEHYEGVLREISERRLVYELEEGVEGTVFVEEVSWEPVEENLKAIIGRSVGESDIIQVLQIDQKYRRMRLSLKRVNESATHTYYRNHQGDMVQVEVEELNALGARVRVVDLEHAAFIPLRELSWLYCRDAAQRVTTGQIIQSRIVSYDARQNQLIASLKHILKNDFEEYSAKMSTGDIVTGEVLYQLGSAVQIKLEPVDGVGAVGYVYKSEVSNIVFVVDDNLASFFAPGQSLPFLIKKFDTRNRLVELSRKHYLKNAFSDVEYGQAYEVRAVRVDRNGTICHGSEIEGRLVDARKRVRLGSEMMVIPARLGSDTGSVELSLQEE